MTPACTSIARTFTNSYALAACACGYTIEVSKSSPDWERKLEAAISEHLAPAQSDDPAGGDAARIDVLPGAPIRAAGDS